MSSEEPKEPKFDRRHNNPGGKREGAGKPKGLKGFSGHPTAPKESLKAQWEGLIYEKTLENLIALYDLADRTEDEALEARIRMELLGKAIPTATKVEQQVDTDITIQVVYEPEYYDSDTVETASGTGEGSTEQSQVQDSVLWSQVGQDGACGVPPVQEVVSTGRSEAANAGLDCSPDQCVDKRG